MYYIVVGLINFGRDEVVVDSGYNQFRVHHTLERAKHHKEEIAKDKPNWVTKIYGLTEIKG